jgi:chorismate dehydratase
LNIALGDIAYLNCHPVRWGLAQAGNPYDLVSDTPPRLCAALMRGSLDVSPVSLLSYLRHAPRLTPLPVAIGSDGPVHSCLLASRFPLDRLDGRTVLLSPQSRTTVFVAQLFLEDVVGVRPVYVTAGSGPAPDADAVVLIGDQALALRHAPPPGWTLHDIGELWRNWTGLPMVFAVWAARRDFAARHPARLAEVTQALITAVALAGASRPAVTAAALSASALPGPALPGPVLPGSALYGSVLSGSELGEAALAAYFQALDYSFGPRQRAAVRALAGLVAKRARLLQEVS